jgi:hypothetical protein
MRDGRQERRPSVALTVACAGTQGLPPPHGDEQTQGGATQHCADVSFRRDALGSPAVAVEFRLQPYRPFRRRQLHRLQGDVSRRRDAPLLPPLTWRSSQHERRSRSSDQGCAGRRGSGGRLLGTLASWNMMLRRKNAASPARCPNPPSRKNRTGPCPLRRSYLPPMQPSAKAPQQSSPSPGDPGEESVQTQFSEARPHYDGLHSRGNQSRAGMLRRLRADS